MKFFEFDWKTFILGIIILLFSSFIYSILTIRPPYFIILIFGVTLIIIPVLEILNLQKVNFDDDKLTNFFKKFVFPNKNDTSFTIVKKVFSIVGILLFLMVIIYGIFVYAYTGSYLFIGFFSNILFYLFHFNEISVSSDKEYYDFSLLNNSLNINNTDQDFIDLIQNGHSLFQLHNYDMALKYYDKAILLNPNNKNLWNIKGVALIKLNKSEDAIREFEKALKIDPNFKRAWINKGSALNDINQNEKAIEAYDSAIKIDPNYADAWDWRSYALICMNRPVEALNSSNTAINLDKNNANAWDNKGNALYSLMKYEEALEAFNQAIEIDPYFNRSWTNKGTTLNKMGLIDEAAQAYNRANMIEKIRLNKTGVTDFFFTLNI